MSSLIIPLTFKNINDHRADVTQITTSLLFYFIDRSNEG